METISNKILEAIAEMSGRLTVLEDRSTSHRLQAAEESRSIGKDVQQVRDLITGNGSPEKGLLVRVDRLEQSSVRRDWLVKACLGSVISTIIGALVVWLKH